MIGATEGFARERLGNRAKAAVSQLVAKTVLPSASLKTRIGGLDELRGIATLWVLVCHGSGTTTWMPRAFAGYGYHGVVLFFIVSGYLITKILIGNESRGEPVRLFYLRRFIRIWPLMIVALLLGCYGRATGSENIVFNFLFVNNYSMASGLEPPFRTDVMWSLAIEEQFYLFWPLVFFVVPRRMIPALLSIVVLVGFLFDGGVLTGGVPINPEFSHAAMQYIALGACVAFGRKGLRAALFAGAAFFIIYLVHGGSPWARNIQWPMWYGLTWGMFALVYATVHFRPIINSAFLAHIGRLCYGIYILHFFVTVVAFTLFDRGVFFAPFTFALLSYLAGLTSFYVIERPALSLRPHLEQSSKTQVVLLLCVLAVVLSSAAVLAVRVGHIAHGI